MLWKVGRKPTHWFLFSVIKAGMEMNILLIHIRTYMLAVLVLAGFSICGKLNSDIFDCCMVARWTPLSAGFVICKL